MTLLGLFALLAAISLPACLSGTNPRSCSWDDAAGGEGECREPDVPSSYNFTIEPKHFALDGKRIALLSGSLHYWRVPPEYWKRTLEALRDMGLNTVETYVPWSLHQPHPSPESITFDGPLDVLRFLRLARSLGLMVGVIPILPALTEETTTRSLNPGLWPVTSMMHLRCLPVAT